MHSAAQEPRLGDSGRDSKSGHVLMGCAYQTSLIRSVRKCSHPGCKRRRRAACSTNCQALGCSKGHRGGARHPAILETLRGLGADAIISLDQEHDSLVSSMGREWTTSGINVVLDYVWGRPAEAVLEAIAQSGTRQAVSRVRFVQVGDAAGKQFRCPQRFCVAPLSSFLEVGSGVLPWTRSSRRWRSSFSSWRDRH